MTVQPLPNEPDLLHDLQAGDAEAFTALYHHYSPMVYVVIQRMVKDPVQTQEIVQDIFSGIWKKHAELEIENLAAYLYKASHNRVVNFFRKIKQDRAQLQDFKVYVEEHYSHIEEALHYQESEALLQQVLSTLTPQQGKVYELIKVKGLSYKEAAAELNLSTYTIKEYLVSANKKIRLYFDNHIVTALFLLSLYGAKNFF
ncbi:RNA polymerase sigma factor (sigma-70 family) [Chitinophaga skermanii]|uniref:RNA polymerase sigma factor (Sigma-70 family) n=1 Tax=Chitinophaga skermanii TaxID=331697 RepID=A0A327Q5Y4_9BACT|nr:sigma-70 family RNA polymerase sigma factor [Chitinophaga skermanii]RAI99384.1 RNA polymerase sigma factor (sigma-70 family) [Chitinophaga skermanii]